MHVFQLQGDEVLEQVCDFVFHEAVISVEANGVIVGAQIGRADAVVKVLFDRRRNWICLWSVVLHLFKLLININY